MSAVCCNSIAGAIITEGWCTQQKGRIHTLSSTPLLATLQVGLTALQVYGCVPGLPYRFCFSGKSYTGLSVRNDLNNSSSSLEWTFIGLQLYRAHIFICLFIWRGLKLYTSAQQSASKLSLYICMHMCMDLLHGMCIHNCKVLHNHSKSTVMACTHMHQLTCMYVSPQFNPVTI